MQILNFLVSTSCLFLLLFSMHLFFAKKTNKLLNILLSIIFFGRFGQIFVSLLITSGHQNILPFFHQAFTPLYYAAPACFYLYLTSFIHGRTQLRKLDWLHFIPALLAIIHVFPWQMATPLNWDIITKQLQESGYFFISEKSGLFPAYFHSMIKPVLVLTYLSASWYQLLRSKIVAEKNPDAAGRNWIFFFLKIATFFQLAGFLPIILRSLHLPFFNSSFVVLNCLALLIVIVFILHQPKIFYGHLLVSVDWKQAPVQIIAAEIKQASPPKEEEGEPILPSVLLKKVKLSAEQLASYSCSMKELMERDSPYLLHDFQIIDLAGKLNVPVHHCSFVINNLIGKNFRDWINGYRIDHFLKQYPVKGDKITIEAVAYESGFKNLATFYNAFKKETGLMPTAYFAQEISV